MSARDVILASIRRSLGVSGSEPPRRQTITDRLQTHPPGIIPRRGNLAPRERIALFAAMVEAAAGTVEEIPRAADVPAAVAAYLRAHNLPMLVRRGADAWLADMPWKRGGLDVTQGRADGSELVAVSHAPIAIAESGTLMLVSGPDNPTTLNFLPDTHIVVVAAIDIAGDYESAWRRLRETYGEGRMPRTVNLITGPSRSADIAQTLILGAHGPRRLHVIVVGEEAITTSRRAERS
jgi:L-lactate dehydrogenase complex protein LldG